MKELKIYRCEFCGATYNEKEKCQTCEQGHKEPKCIFASKYWPVSLDATGYPSHIDIKMNDGKIVRYKRLREK